jgi:hypothetical protein
MQLLGLLFPSMIYYALVFDLLLILFNFILQCFYLLRMVASFCWFTTVSECFYLLLIAFNSLCHFSVARLKIGVGSHQLLTTTLGLSKLLSH